MEKENCCRILMSKPFLTSARKNEDIITISMKQTVYYKQQLEKSLLKTSLLKELFSVRAKPP